MAGLANHLARCFETKIRTGEWSRQTRIPAERELMVHYRASRNSIRRALKQLEDKGLVSTVQGSGRRVIACTENAHKMIGLLARGTEFVDGNQNTRIFASASQAVAALGHHLVTFSINYGNQTVEGLDDGASLQLDRLDGAIVLARQYLIEDIARLSRRLPVVALTHDAAEANVPSFFIDFGVHATLATQRLTALGHRRILLAFDNSPFHDRIGADMRRGFSAGLILSGIAPVADLIVRSPLTREAGRCLYRQLRQQQSDVTAIVSYGENLCLGMIDAAAAEGDDLRRRMAMVCLTDAREDDTLAHFRCPVEQAARDAVDALSAMIAGQDVTEMSHPYYGQLADGQTLIAPPAAQSPPASPNNSPADSGPALQPKDASPLP